MLVRVSAFLSSRKGALHSSPKPFNSVLTSTWNPRTNALTKSEAFVSEPMSCVSLHVWKKEDTYYSHTLGARENQCRWALL